MRETVFSAEELPDIEELKRRLFENENDPRSTAYVRRLERPQIRWGLLLLNWLLPLAAAGALIAVLLWLGLSQGTAVGIAAGCLGLYVLLRLKAMLIGAVHLYQRFAPEHIRKKCRFEPSCSQYMILSLKKYGLVKGLAKGIDRLKRCNIHDGGFDEPYDIPTMKKRSS